MALDLRLSVRLLSEAELPLPLPPLRLLPLGYEAAWVSSSVKISVCPASAASWMADFSRYSIKKK